ncbi:MAG: restriction endonuclease subunit S [Sulfurimonas sp.]|jgi:type I restriction enzyme S subunit
MVAEGYKDTEIGVIPIQWEVKSLSEIGSFSKGKGISKNEVIKDGIPCMRYAEIYTKYNTVLKNIKSFIDKNSALNSKQIYNRDILFAGSGETLEDIGKSVAFIDDFEAYVGGDTVILSPDIDYNALFMAYQLNSTSVRTQLRKLGQGNSVVHIYSSGLEKVIVSFPPLREQEKIADILSTADAKIDAIASQIEKAETLKKGLLQKLLSEGIGHSEFKDTGLSIVYPMRKIPNSWELKTLSDITTKITDGAHFTPTYVESGIPFLRVTDLKSKDLLASNIKYIPEEEHIELLKRCNPEYGDILYSKNGTIGLTRIVTWDWEFSIFVSLCLIKPNKDLIIPEYLKYYLTSSIVDTQIMIRAKQGAVTNLHLEEIRDFFITIPPLEEQKQIADILSTADEKLEVLRAKKEKYETLKKGLLQKLLSGEVRV